MSLKSQVTAMFMKAWRAYGQPVIAVAPPLGAWSLPAGYAFADEVDGIQTTGGATITDMDALAAYFAMDTVYIVPVKETADLHVLIATGIVPSGSTEVYVLQDDVATVRAAHAVQVNGEWYNVADAGKGPVGHPAGIWAKVRLERRA